jgi:hypothetical protein
MTQISSDKLTKYDRYVRWCKDHKIIAPVLFSGTVLSVTIGFVLLIFPSARSWLTNDAFTNETISIIDNAIEIAIEDHPEERSRLEIINSLYSDLAEGDFNAGEYFAPLVDTYYLVHNYTPWRIDSIYAENRKDFKEPRSNMESWSFNFFRKENGHHVVSFWSDFTCFRIKKQKRQNCRVKTEIIFDENDKIISLSDVEILNLKYTSE